MRWLARLVLVGLIALATTAGAAERRSAAGYRFLGEGSGWSAWAKGGRVYKVLTFWNQYTGRTTPGDPRRAAAALEQVEGSARLRASGHFAARWGHVFVPAVEPTRVAGIVTQAEVTTGLAFEHLKGGRARRRARRQIARITDDAVVAFDEHFVTDTARSNFRFDRKGHIVAWFDPVHGAAYRFAPVFHPGGRVELVLHRVFDAPYDPVEDPRAGTEMGRVGARLTGPMPAITRLPGGR